jgi:hypothetical protein
MDPAAPGMDPAAPGMDPAAPENIKSAVYTALYFCFFSNSAIIARGSSSSVIIKTIYSPLFIFPYSFS